MIIPDWDTFSRYLEDVPHVKPRSWHKTVLYRFTVYYADRNLETIEDLGGFFRYIREEYEVINATLNSYLKIVRHICDKLGPSYKGISDQFKRFPEQEPLIIPLTEEELSSLIKSAYLISFKVGLVTELLGRTGMRNETELCHLTWNDLQGDTIILRNTKNGVPNVLPLFGLSEKLRAYKAMCTCKYGMMFEGTQGPIKYDTVNKYLKQAAQKAGITKYVHAHILRHTFAQISTDNDVNTLKLKAWMNHKSITSTARYVQTSMKSKMDVGRVFPLMAKHMSLQDVELEGQKYYERIKLSPFQKEFINNDEEIVIRIKKHT